MISLREGLELSGGGLVCLVGAGGKTSLMFRLARELSAAGNRVLTTTTTKIRMPAPEQSEAVVISASMDAIAERAGKLQTRKFHFTAAEQRLGAQDKLKGYAPEFVDELWRCGLFRWILVEADGAAGRPLKAPAAHEPVIPSSTGWVVGVVGLDAAGKPLNERSVFRPQLFSKLTGLPLGRRVSAQEIAAALTHAEGIFKGSPAGCRRYIFLNKAESVARIRAGRAVVKAVEAAADAQLKRILIGSLQRDPPILEYHDIVAG